MKQAMEPQVSLADIDNTNRVAELAMDIENAINEGKDAKRLETLRSNCVFVGSMIVRAYQAGNLDEEKTIKLGQNVNRCKRMCEKYMAESVNF
jgi:hypothetical protein